MKIDEGIKPRFDFLLKAERIKIRYKIGFVHRLISFIAILIIILYIIKNYLGMW